MQLLSGLSEAEQADVVARVGGVELSSIPALNLHVIAVPAGESAGYLDAYRADPAVVTPSATRSATPGRSPTTPATPTSRRSRRSGGTRRSWVVDPAGTASNDTGWSSGGFTLKVEMTDQGEPGKSDSFSVHVMSGTTVVFSSHWTGTKTIEQVLGGGNLVVHEPGRSGRPSGRPQARGLAISSRARVA